LAFIVTVNAGVPVPLLQAKSRASFPQVTGVMVASEVDVLQLAFSHVPFNWK